MAYNSKNLAQWLLSDAQQAIQAIMPFSINNLLQNHSSSPFCLFSAAKWLQDPFAVPPINDSISATEAHHQLLQAYTLPNGGSYHPNPPGYTSLVSGTYYHQTNPINPWHNYHQCGRNQCTCHTYQHEILPPYTCPTKSSCQSMKTKFDSSHQCPPHQKNQFQTRQNPHFLEINPLQRERGVFLFNITTSMETSSGLWLSPLTAALQRAIKGAFRTIFFSHFLITAEGVPEGPNILYGTERISIQDSECSHGKYGALGSELSKEHPNLEPTNAESSSAKVGRLTWSILTLCEACENLSGSPEKPVFINPKNIEEFFFINVPRV
ncbi:hypothetical protein VP01_1944g1 [Puccinia sorghi]|uniref:Uncharacterized protein n=1 Tax=Puccinia sorghi TaxID=27349 RepID=A0A0L6VCD9_9BASI|nr:hypothetical protein VP01_1944g1 [Puccinia sorghi]